MKTLPLLSLLVASVVATSAFAHPDFGPGSPAWGSDLETLSAAVEANAPDLSARVQAFCQKHRFVQSLRRLERAAGLFPQMANGRSDPDDPMNSDPTYRVAAIATTPYPLQKYGEKLAQLLPRVDAGEKSLAWARKRAARGFRWSQVFTDVTGCEIADLNAKAGVMISTPSWKKATFEIFRLASWDPDRYKTFKSTWEDLHTRIVLSEDYQVLQLDRDTPQEGYRSFVEAMRVMGELAPSLPEDNPDEVVFVPGDA